MATIVLGAAGFILSGGNPAGAMIGASIGNMIDRMTWLAPSSPDIQGPRLADKTVMGSEPGEPIPITFGTDRVAGKLIWCPGLIETRHDEEVGGKGGGGGTATSFTYSCHALYLLGERREGCRNTVGRVWIDGKPLRTRNEDGTYSVSDCDSFTILDGNADQLPWLVLEAALGAGNAPAYRDRLCVGIENLQLANFGNRLSANVTFEVIQRDYDGADPETVASAIDFLAPRSGLAQGQWRHEGLAAVACRPGGVRIRGYTVARDGSMRSILDPLLTAYVVDAVDQGNRLLFRKRDRDPDATLLVADFAASSDRESLPPRFEVDLADPVDLPRLVTVKHIDPDRDYQQNTQYDSRLTGGAGGAMSVELPLVLTAEEGRQAAERMLAEAWTGRATYPFTLPPKYLALDPTDLVSVTVDDASYTIRLTEATIGANGLLEMKGVAQRAATYRTVLPGDSGRIASPGLNAPEATSLALMDLPPLRDQDDTMGFYWAVAGRNAWKGAVLYRSFDGVTYTAIAGTSLASPMGHATTVLPDTGQPWEWDLASTVTVELTFGELAAASDLDLYNGANAALLGDEIIQFGQADLVSAVTGADGGVTRTYTLSRLLRARKGTERATGTHAANERFVLLQPGVTQFFADRASTRNAEVSYKAVTLGATLDDAAAVTFTNGGAVLMPLSPVHILGARDGSDNLTIAWTRRARIDAEWLDSVDVPLDEPTQAYELDVLGAGGAVLRTLSVTAPTATYSAADQTADGLTPGDPVTVRVYQISARVGRGFPGEATI